MQMRFSWGRDESFKIKNNDMQVWKKSVKSVNWFCLLMVRGQFDGFFQNLKLIICLLEVYPEDLSAHGSRSTTVLLSNSSHATKVCPNTVRSKQLT